MNIITFFNEPKEFHQQSGLRGNKNQHYLYIGMWMTLIDIYKQFIRFHKFTFYTYFRCIFYPQIVNSVLLILLTNVCFTIHYSSLGLTEFRMKTLIKFCKNIPKYTCPKSTTYTHSMCQVIWMSLQALYVRCILCYC